MNMIVKSLGHSLDGLRHAWRAQHKVRITTVAVGVALPLALLLARTPLEWALMMMAVLLSLALEIVNSGLEELCDHVTPERHPDIKAIKDMGSATVFCAHLIGLMVWGAIAFQRFTDM